VIFNLRSSVSAGRKSKSTQHHQRAAFMDALEPRRLFALSIVDFDPVNPATTLTDALVVPSTGLTVTGATFVGQPGQAGFFTGFNFSDGSQKLNLGNGILLTNGDAQDALGPNDTTGQTTATDTAGDTQLDFLVGADTFDANALTLTFASAPGTNSILLDFVFGSEEFPEFVGSAFNDAFAAYLDGEQISFDSSDQPITVNNNFFQFSNNGGTDAGKTPVQFDIQYDGLTPHIRTKAPLSGTDHVLKLVIADAADRALDSGVFLSRLQGSTAVLTEPQTELPASGEFEISPLNVTVAEDGGSVTLTINRTNGTDGLVTVDYATTNGTATDGLDFTGVSGTLTFADGQASQTVIVPILDDMLLEQNETFTFTLSNAQGSATLSGDASATVTILENDDQVYIADANYTFAENAGNAVLTLVRLGGLNEDATVVFTTTDGTATGGLDYTPRSQTVTLPAGARTTTISIPLLTDALVGEPTETFTVTLSNGTNGVSLGATPSAVVNILDVDTAGPTVTRTDLVTGSNGKIRAIRLTYSEPIFFFPETKNYGLADRGTTGPLVGTAKNVKIRSISYDAATSAVTIVPKGTFKSNRFYQVTASPNGGITDRVGNVLDGDANGINGGQFSTFFARGNNIAFTETDADKVRLRISGGGVLQLIAQGNWDNRHVSVFNGSSQDSILIGSVLKKRSFGDDRSFFTSIENTGDVINGLGDDFITGVPA